MKKKSFIDEIEELQANSLAKIEDSLTPCQQKAAADIIAWSYRENDLFATLCGAAGTGKSWLSRFLLPQLMQKRICVSAPTHQAVGNIKKLSGYPGKTLQSLLGLAPYTDVEDFDPNKPEFAQINNPTIFDYDFILVDEASMVNNNLREYVEELATEAEIKVLWVGDHIQLPPVKEVKSSVFIAENVNGNVFKLETPCRQSMDNPLYLLLLACRADIEGTQSTWNYVKEQLKTLNLWNDETEALITQHHNRLFAALFNRFPTLINEKSEGYGTYDNRKEFEDTMKDVHADYIINKNYQGVRTLGWRNKTMLFYNQSIRNSLFQDIDVVIAPGDIVKCYRPVTAYDKRKRKVFTVIHNSDELLILTANKAKSGMRYPIWQCSAESLVDGKQHILEFVDPIAYNQFTQQWLKYKFEAKVKGYGRLYKFWDSHLNLADMRELMNNKFAPMKCFDYAYAITTHKAQGSTYEEVFVDTADIKAHYSINKFFLTQEDKWDDKAHIDYTRITRQLLYVALSRASKFAHILK